MRAKTRLKIFFLHIVLSISSSLDIDTRPFHLITLSALARTFGWYRQADLLRGFQIDDELELHRLLYGQVGGLSTFKILST